MDEELGEVLDEKSGTAINRDNSVITSIAYPADWLI
jgi:hypothetical protein